MKVINKRKTYHSVNKIFPSRWSPRAMSGEKVSKKELFTLFEAARWAPSSYNGQPWHFIYAFRGTKHWKTLSNLMVEFNQQWTKNAGVLLVIFSRNTFYYNNKRSRTHTFDTGAAWGNFALQGSFNNLVVHGMEGFDYGKAAKVLGIPKGYTVEAMAAVGKPGRKKDLPKDIQKMEAQSDRKKVNAFVSEGRFKKK